MRLLALTLIAVAASSCGIDRNVESRVTITTGVYGQTTVYDDVQPTSIKYHQMEVQLQRPDGSLSTSTTSGDQGFYQLATEPADYKICTAFGRCLAITVVAGQRLRCDFEFSFGGQWECTVQR